MMSSTPQATSREQVLNGGCTAKGRSRSWQLSSVGFALPHLRGAPATCNNKVRAAESRHASCHESPAAFNPMRSVLSSRAAPCGPDRYTTQVPQQTPSLGNNNIAVAKWRCLMATNFYTTSGRLLSPS